MRITSSLGRVTLLGTVLIAGCASGGSEDTSEEDAIADASAPGKGDSGFPIGFYQAFDIDHEDDEGLHAIFHEDGSMDYTKFINDGSETEYSPGTFRVYKYRGRDRLRLVDQTGKVVFRGDWATDEDGDLTFGGETWLESTPDASNVANCVAMHVRDTSMFEEGFTEYEYPDLSIVKVGTKYKVEMGAGSIDSSDGTVDVTINSREILVAADLGEQRLEIEIPKRAPRRGIVTYSEEATGPLHVMADIVCR